MEGGSRSGKFCGHPLCNGPLRGTELDDGERTAVCFGTTSRREKLSVAEELRPAINPQSSRPTTTEDRFLGCESRRGASVPCVRLCPSSSNLSPTFSRPLLYGKNSLTQCWSLLSFLPSHSTLFFHSRRRTFRSGLLRPAGWNKKEWMSESRGSAL